MFPGSEIAKNKPAVRSKIKYSIQYGIAPYLKQKLIYDVKDKPFTFKFDGTTIRNVSKQYDAYLQYWSKSYNQIVDAYCGSLFLGHYTSDNLVEHYKHFAKELNLDLLIGMDGPNVNLSFEKKLNETGRRHGCSFLKAWYMFTPPSPHCISQRYHQNPI